MREANKSQKPAANENIERKVQLGDLQEPVVSLRLGDLTGLPRVSLHFVELNPKDLARFYLI